MTRTITTSFMLARSLSAESSPSLDPTRLLSAPSAESSPSLDPTRRSTGAGGGEAVGEGVGEGVGGDDAVGAAVGAANGSHVAWSGQCG